ncbi:hypothetical protein pb186bvf_000993 [Paramecium bursaria]
MQNTYITDQVDIQRVFDQIEMMKNKSQVLFKISNKKKLVIVKENVFIFQDDRKIIIKVIGDYEQEIIYYYSLQYLIAIRALGIKRKRFFFIDKTGQIIALGIYKQRIENMGQIIHTNYIPLLQGHIFQDNCHLIEFFVLEMACSLKNIVIYSFQSKKMIRQSKFIYLDKIALDEHQLTIYLLNNFSIKSIDITKHFKTIKEIDFYNDNIEHAWYHQGTNNLIAWAHGGIFIFNGKSLQLQQQLNLLQYQEYREWKQIDCQDYQTQIFYDSNMNSWVFSSQYFSIVLDFKSKRSRIFPPNIISLQYPTAIIYHELNIKKQVGSFNYLDIQYIED